MKKMFFLAICFSLCLFSSVHSAEAKGLMDKYSVRVTIVENGIIHEWEYDSPNKYEYEKGEKVVKGEKGKKEVMQIVSALKLHKDIELDELMSNLKKNTKFTEIERLDVRMIDGDGKLYTWVWDHTLSFISGGQ